MKMKNWIGNVIKYGLVMLFTMYMNVSMANVHGRDYSIEGYGHHSSGIGIVVFIIIVIALIGEARNEAKK